MFDAIIFDMDGTLVDTEAVIADCMARWLSSRGFEMDDDQKSYVIGRAWSDIWEKLASELGLPFGRDEAEEGILSLKDEVVNRDGLVVLPGDGGWSSLIALVIRGSCSVLVWSFFLLKRWAQALFTVFTVGAHSSTPPLRS